VNKLGDLQTHWVRQCKSEHRGKEGGRVVCSRKSYISLNIASKKVVQEKMMSFLGQNHRTYINSYGSTNLHEASADAIGIN